MIKIRCWKCGHLVIPEPVEEKGNPRWETTSWVNRFLDYVFLSRKQKRRQRPTEQKNSKTTKAEDVTKIENPKISIRTSKRPQNWDVQDAGKKNWGFCPDCGAELIWTT